MLSAEIEEYEEATTKVKINFYKNWCKANKSFIKLTGTLEEVSREQAESIVIATNRFNSDIKGIEAQIDNLSNYKNKNIDVV